MMIDDLSKLVVNELSIELRTVWDIYIKFYTAFLVFNITGLGLVAEKVHSRKAQVIITGAFIVQNILSSFTALEMAKYSKDTADRVHAILKVAVEKAVKAKPESITQEAIPHLVNESPLPGNLGKYAGRANFTSHMIMIAAWLAVAGIQMHKDVSSSRAQAPPTSRHVAGDYNVHE